MKFGLKQADIDAILEAVRRFPEIKQVVIFGSRAKNSHQKGSDIDLSINGKDITFQIARRLSALLNEELPLPYFFDVVHYEEIENKDLKEHIDRVGKILGDDI